MKVTLALTEIVFLLASATLLISRVPLCLPFVTFILGHLPVPQTLTILEILVLALFFPLESPLGGILEEEQKAKTLELP